MVKQEFDFIAGKQQNTMFSLTWQRHFKDAFFASIALRCKTTYIIKQSRLPGKKQHWPTCYLEKPSNFYFSSTEMESGDFCPPFLVTSPFRGEFSHGCFFPPLKLPLPQISKSDWAVVCRPRSEWSDRSWRWASGGLWGRRSTEKSMVL